MTAPAPLHVVCSTDDDYALPTATMVASLAASASPGRRLTLHVLDGGMSAPVSARLRRAIRHTAKRADRRGITLARGWHTPDLARTDGLRTHGHLSATAYLRLQFADLLVDGGFEGVGRALWLDSDVLVLRDLARVAAVDLCDPLGRPAPAAAVRNATGTMGRAIPTRAWATPEAAYMNTGVMVLDPSRWRDEALGDAILSDLRVHQDGYRWWDQCGTNAVLNGRWAELERTWNVQVGSRASRRSPSPLSEAGVLHFTGPWKPWQADYAVRAATSPEAVAGLTTFRAAWLAAARASGWFSPAQWAAFRSRLALAERMSRARRGAGRAKRAAFSSVRHTLRLGAEHV